MRTRRAALFRLAAAACAPWLLPGSARAQSADVLKMGLIPFLSTRALVNVFDPLRLHLEQSLGRPVVAFTAVNHVAFAGSLREGDYDFAFMPAHTMHMAADDWGYVPLARTRAPTRIVLATRADSPLDSIDALRGKRVVLLDRLAITSMVALDELGARGLRAGRDLEVEYLVNISSVLLALDRPDVDAVAVIEGTLQDFPLEARGRVRVLAHLRTVPSPGFAAHPRLAAAERERLRGALLAFTGAPGGSGSMARAPLELVARADLEPLGPYAARLRRELAAR
ncbi:MAG: phosphate/phosphite/phosphonate ABC transporter substrate-binding protein [Burkholderiaceae bacterium]|jgi:phosphonate transport system substrate-binding protein|nr:phosphate/phosphite/phosphonate ABC transporter substrate-binding protein [Burkholderiaceae bacterium]